MPTSYTNLLGLALPVQGELSGTWGNEVNNYITQYLDASVAGTQTISGSQTAVTLSKTTNAALSQAGTGATGSSQYQIINCTGNPATQLTVTVPAASKAYLVLNNTSTNQSVKIVGAGPTAGVTVAAARCALIAWDGTDFELVASTDASTLSGVLAATNGGTGQSSYAVGDLLYASTTTALSKLAGVATGNALISGGVNTAPSYGKIGLTTHVSGTLPIANGGTGATTNSAARTNLGASTLGSNIFTITNPSAITFPRFNADNTVSALSAADFRTAIGAGTGGGTVSSVAFSTGTTGLTVSGSPITTSGTITLAGTLAVANGGTGATTFTAGTYLKGNGTSAIQAQSGIPASDITSGTLGVARGGTGATSLTANNVLLGNGTSALQVVAPGTSGNVLTSNGTTWTSAAPGGSVVQYPQNSQSANYTFVLSDAGKMIYHPSSDTAKRTWTVPSNASVPYPIGTTILILVAYGAGAVKLTINSDTLRSPDGLTGTKTISPGDSCLLYKTASTEWYVYEQNVSPQSATLQIAVAHNTSPFVSAYPWSSSGFGTKYANPGTLPTGTGLGVAFSPAGDAIAVAHETSLFVSAYTWSSSGFGTKYADPGTLPTGIGLGVAFSPAGDAIAVAHDSSPRVSAYPWSSSGFGTKFANPGTLPTGTGLGVAFSPAGDAIAVAHANSPFVSAYPWSSSGFGTKYADPGTLLTGAGRSVAFSPAGDAIAVAHDSSPRVSAYPWSSSGFGTKFANPGTLPTGTGRSVAFSPAGDAIAVAHDTTPYVSAYPWSSSGFGTKYANPGTLPTGTGYGVAFSPAGDAIAVAHANSPFVSAYPWSSSGFGTKYADPGTLPTGIGLGVAFNEI